MRESLESHDFESTEARNEYIDRVFPKRVMSLTEPGVFYLSDGRIVTVFMEHVELWSAKCEGIQDQGAVCEGGDIRVVRAKGPETDWDTIVAGWCEACRQDAVSLLGFEIEEIK